MARLLWRGSFHLHNGDSDFHSPGTSTSHTDAQHYQLHGLAIVASSFSLPSSSMPIHSLEPDDPFSSSSSPFKIDTTGELCLDIEMLRNTPLFLETRRSRVRIACVGDSDDEDLDNHTDASLLFNTTAKPPHGRKALKKSIELLRKGKQRSSDLQPETVYLDTQQDSSLSLYIDSRCQDTIAYFNDIFCKEAVNSKTGKTRFGIAVALEREDELGISSANAQRKIVVYGQVAPGPHASRPIMQLHIAKFRNKKQMAARPDAPAPRENLFAQKLRRTVSQPVLSMKGASASKPSKIKLSTSTDSLTIGSLSTRTLSTSHTAKARNLFGKPKPVTLPGSGKPGNTSSAVNGKSTTLMQAPLPHASPGRRGQKRARLTAGGLKALEEVTEHDQDVGLGQDDEEEGSLHPFKRMRDRDGSPTPSVATNRSFTSVGVGPNALKATNAGTNSTRKGAAGSLSMMKRSMSMPPGQLDFGIARAGSVVNGAEARATARIAREVSLAPTDITMNNQDENGSSSLETRNKGTMRKILLAAMTARSCGREHEDFKDVFAVAYKGLQCAFRHSLRNSKIEKEEISAMTQKHLDMYISRTTTTMTTL